LIKDTLCIDRNVKRDSQGWDIARGVALIPGSTTQGYVVDGWGGMHPFGGALPVTSLMYTPGGITKQLAVS
jgi:hypothetical protein